MPSRKQRKRRQKELRHEYEFVAVDEEGHEVEVDPDDLRAKRAEEERGREQARAKDGKSATTTAGKPARRGREVPPPSWSRTWKRAGAFTAVMFLALSFLSHGGSMVSRVVLTLAYGALFVPFLYFMDRVQYRQYLRRTGQSAEAPKQTSSRGAAPAAPKRENGRRGLLRRGSRG